MLRCVNECCVSNSAKEVLKELGFNFSHSYACVGYNFSDKDLKANLSYITEEDETNLSDILLVTLSVKDDLKIDAPKKLWSIAAACKPILFMKN
ncbi:hypothetical protein HZS_7721 [Henneguya salminicola]|nr:hypothetical protein HZS_7721 [Henneguya salminicola]